MILPSPAFVSLKSSSILSALFSSNTSNCRKGSESWRSLCLLFWCSLSDRKSESFTDLRQSHEMNSRESSPMCNSPISTPPISRKVPAREEGNNVGGDRGAPEFWVRLTVASRVQAINPTVNKLKKMLKAACLERTQAFAIETALREALANAIVHGNRLNRAKSVRVGCGCSQRGIRIVIADEGEGFDPGALESPLAAKNLNSDHGRGILLIQALMDGVRFEKGGREIHMCKNRVRKSESKGQHG